MKNPGTIGFCFLFLLSSFFSIAQEKTIPVNEPDYKKPRQFDNLPDRIVLNLSNINSLMKFELGHTVNINLSDATPFQFQGDVVSTADDNESKIHSIVIRSSNYPGASLTISKITKPDGTIDLKGRILSFQHGDLYDLQKQNGQYVLVKRNFYELVNE